MEDAGLGLRAQLVARPTEDGAVIPSGVEAVDQLRREGWTKERKRWRKIEQIIRRERHGVPEPSLAFQRA